jgi:single-stranded DNA-binding protein
MSIPTQLSLTGFIATVPDLTFTSTGKARFYARVGSEHYRKEVDGTFTKLDPTFHDLVLFEATAERAYARLRKGDSFVASGYIHQYEARKDGTTVVREEFVARRIGHDTARTTYEVQRRHPSAAEQVAEQAAQPARASVEQVPPPVVGV